MLKIGSPLGPLFRIFGSPFDCVTVLLQGITKEQVEWSTDKTVVSYSAITGGHVRVEGYGCNPYHVEEEEDELEVVDEVQAGDDDVVELTDEEVEEDPSGSPVSPGTMKKRRKAAKKRRS